MKKIFLILIILSTYVFSAINECKTDVYFANGILTKQQSAIDNALLLEDEIKQKLGIDNYNKNIGKVDYAYNSTLSPSKDMYEAYLQLKAEGGVSAFQEFMLNHFPLVELLAGDDVKNILDEKVHEKMIKEVHDADLVKQVKKYKESIDSGHGVIVIAHSQGALFTNEAYDLVVQNAVWRDDFFKAFFVAPASTKVLKTNIKTPAYIFHNDVITNLSDRFNFPKETNPNLFEKKILGQFDTEPTYLSEKDKIFHSFKYYMGESIGYIDGRGNHNVSTNLAKDAILGFVSETVVGHRKRDSQWRTDQEFDKNTCDYKITLKHQYDPSIEMGEKVYPFNASKKLYQVKGEYVKASCGGKNILETWDGKKDNECLMIDNVEEEKILGGQRFIGDDEKGTVLDTNTSLIWQNKDIVTKPWLTRKNYNERRYFDTSGDTATTYCENLSLGGYGDWRLPTRGELRSVFEPPADKLRQEIYDNFTLPSNFCWSSTTYGGDGNSAWIIKFVYYGGGYGGNKYANGYVRCVRAGQ